MQDQTLAVVARLYPQICSGAKTATIRWRETRIVPGPLTFLCDGDDGRRVTVEVLRCTDMPLARAAAFLGKSDIWPDDVMLHGMREHYPEIALDSMVHVVEFRLPDAG